MILLLQIVGYFLTIAVRFVPPTEVASSDYDAEGTAAHNDSALADQSFEKTEAAEDQA